MTVCFRLSPRAGLALNGFTLMVFSVACAAAGASSLPTPTPPSPAAERLDQHAAHPSENEVVFGEFEANEVYIPPSRASEHLAQRLAEYPEEHQWVLDDDIVVTFAYPHHLFDWAGSTFIYHLPSASVVSLERSFEAPVIEKDYADEEG